MTVVRADAPRPDALFFRGLLFALPISLALWGLLIAATVFVIN